MKRVRTRLTLLAAIRVAVGVILFCVIYAKLVGKSDLASTATVVSLLIFLWAEALFGGETETAIEAVNLRVDQHAGHDIRQDARLDAIERILAMKFDDTPPHGIPIVKP